MDVIDYDAQAVVRLWGDRDETGLISTYVRYDGISFAEAVRRVVAMLPEEKDLFANIGTHERVFNLSEIEAIARRDDFPQS